MAAARHMKSSKSHSRHHVGEVLSEGRQAGRQIIYGGGSGPTDRVCTCGNLSNIVGAGHTP